MFFSLKILYKTVIQKMYCKHCVNYKHDSLHFFHFSIFHILFYLMILQQVWNVCMLIAILYSRYLRFILLIFNWSCFPMDLLQFGVSNKSYTFINREGMFFFFIFFIKNLSAKNETLLLYESWLILDC